MVGWLRPSVVAAAGVVAVLAVTGMPTYDPSLVDEGAAVPGATVAVAVDWASVPIEPTWLKALAMLAESTPSRDIFSPGAAAIVAGARVENWFKARSHWSSARQRRCARWSPPSRPGSFGDIPDRLVQATSIPRSIHYGP